MNIQHMINDAKAQADANGDGKLTHDDLSALAEKHGIDQATTDSLTAKADANGDGKMDLEDLKAGLGNASGMLGDIKDRLFGSK